MVGIANVRTAVGRCEDIAHDRSHRGTYHIVTARAVAPTNTLLELCMPFVAPGGIFVAAKGPNCEVCCLHAQDSHPWAHWIDLSACAFLPCLQFMC
jgi:16S rRNA G527 N7-methylase RsmG